jgi:hypothetical protein
MHILEHLAEPACVASIVAQNIQHRHLSTSQRAMLAAHALQHFEELARKRMQAGKANPSPTLDEGRADANAGAQYKVGHSSVAKAKVVAEKDAELAEQVAAGSVSLITPRATL